MSSPVDPWSGPPEHGAQPSYPPPSSPPRAARHAHPEHPEPRPDGWRPPPPLDPTPAPPNWSATLDEPTQVHRAISPVPPAKPDLADQDRQPAETGGPAAPSDSAAPSEPVAGASRRPARSTLLLSFGLAGLLLLTLGGLAYLTRSSGEISAPPPAAAPPSAETPHAAGSAEPTPSTEPSPEPSPEPQIRLVAPKTLDGRARSTDSELKALAAELVKDLEAKVSSGNSTVGAFYGSFEDEDIIMIAAASGFVLNPEQELDATVKKLASDLNVRKMSTISAGPLGGVAKCGDGSASDIKLGVCAWADKGSIGMIVMFSASASTARSNFADIRAEIEKRS